MSLGVIGILSDYKVALEFFGHSAPPCSALLFLLCQLAKKIRKVDFRLSWEIWATLCASSQNVAPPQRRASPCTRGAKPASWGRMRPQDAAFSARPPRSSPSCDPFLVSFRDVASTMLHLHDSTSACPHHAHTVQALPMQKRSATSSVTLLQLPPLIGPLPCSRQHVTVQPLQPRASAHLTRNAEHASSNRGRVVRYECTQRDRASAPSAAPNACSPTQTLRPSRAGESRAERSRAEQSLSLK